MELIEKLKAMFAGNPDAQALIAEAEAEQGAAPLADNVVQFPRVAEAGQAEDVNAPPARNVTLRARYDAERARCKS